MTQAATESDISYYAQLKQTVEGMRAEVTGLAHRALSGERVFNEELLRLWDAVEVSWKGLHQVKPNRVSAIDRLVDVLNERMSDLRKELDRLTSSVQAESSERKLSDL